MSTPKTLLVDLDTLSNIRQTQVVLVRLQTVCPEHSGEGAGEEPLQIVRELIVCKRNLNPASALLSQTEELRAADSSYFFQTTAAWVLTFRVVCERNLPVSKAKVDINQASDKPLTDHGNATIIM